MECTCKSGLHTNLRVRTFAGRSTAAELLQDVPRLLDEGGVQSTCEPGLHTNLRVHTFCRTFHESLVGSKRSFGGYSTR